MSSLRKSYGKLTGEGGILSRNCSSNGVLGGPSEMNVNGSVIPVDFWIEPLEGQQFLIKYISLALNDSGNFNAGGYGGIETQLVNGIDFFIEISGNRVNFTAVPITRNEQLLSISSESQSYLLTGNDRIIVFREILTDFADPLLLKAGDKFGVEVKDNLTALNHHSCRIKGAILAEA
jgi:hypothetical protein